MSCTRILVSSALFFFAMSTYAGEPPDIRLMDGTLATAPSPNERPTGPPLGIQGSPYSRGRITGVMVDRDNSRRELWYLTSDRQRKRATFAPGRDVIMKVNGHPVRSPSDILRNTHSTWTKLTIKDLETGATGDYWVDLE